MQQMAAAAATVELKQNRMEQKEFDRRFSTFFPSRSSASSDGSCRFNGIVSSVFFQLCVLFRACVSTRSCSSLIRLDFLHACDDDDDHDDDNDFVAPPDARVSFGGGGGEVTLDHRSRVSVKVGDELLTFDTLMFIQFSNPPEHNQL